MADELLSELDRSIARTDERHDARRGARHVAARPAPAVSLEIAGELSEPRRGRLAFRDRYPLVEAFVVVQCLWGALLFLPGAQAYRAVIRALPYVSSVLLILAYLPKRTDARQPGSASFIVAALAVLVLNLLHPTTQPRVGMAQVFFQLTIVAPVFWAWKAVRTEERLLKVILLAFLLNALSAALGVLQVYFPDRFMPPQFSTLGLQMNESWVDSLTYEGADGRMIVRPPGLTDQPGGASVAGAVAATLGFGLTLAPIGTTLRIVGLAGAGAGLAVLYLTQVRSLLLMCLGAFAVMAVLAFRRGRVGAAVWVVGGGGALVLATFMWAASIGGERVEERYTDIAQKGAVQTFRENRGHFLSYTLGELLDQYPLGAGVGRWGMMNVYFGDPTDLSSPPIYVEIQLTGWLLDGGLPLWLFYGGAILSALAMAVRLAQQRKRTALADLATLVLALLMLVCGMSFAGPVFNTQMGILFWFLVAALYGAGTLLLPHRTYRYR